MFNLIHEKMENVQFIQMSPKDLVALITESVSIQLNEHFNKSTSQKVDENEFLTRKETADLFKVSLVTIHEWVKQELIKPYKLGNRTYFKRSELVESLFNSNRI